MGGEVAHDAVALATRGASAAKATFHAHRDRKRERLDGEMHSINLFSDAYTRQVEALTRDMPKSREEFRQPTHTARGPQDLLGSI